MYGYEDIYDFEAKYTHWGRQVTQDNPMSALCLLSYYDHAVVT